MFAIACNSCGCSWEPQKYLVLFVFFTVRFWAVPVSRSNEFHSVIAHCANNNLLPRMYSIDTWRNSCYICWFGTCRVDRELQPARLWAGNRLGISSKWTEFENSLKKNVKYGTRKGCCRKGKRSYSSSILPCCKTWEEFCKSFVVKLHFKHTYHLAFDL